MAAPSVKEQLFQQIKNLTPEQHNQLSPGTPGEVWLANMGSFQFDPGELESMQQAIEEHCESIDLNC